MIQPSCRLVGSGDDEKGADRVHATNIGNSTGVVNGYLTGSRSAGFRFNYRPMLDEILSRIERRLAALKMTATEASRAAGLGEDAIRNIRRAIGKENRPGVSTSTIFALAPILKVSPAWLLTGEGDETSTPPMPEVIPVTVGMRRAVIDGMVEAGSWRQVDDFDQSERRYIDVPSDDEFPHASIRVFEVAGDSMNAYEKAPLKPGSLAVCLDYDDVVDRMPKRNGMVVVVERTADGGQFRERSIKELEVHDDHLEFHPRSTNPAHKSFIVPIDYEADDGVKVQILAVLRRVISETIRF